MQAIISKANAQEKKLKNKKLSEGSISTNQKSFNISSSMTVRSEKKSLQKINQLLKDSIYENLNDKQNTKITWMEIMDNKIMAEHQLKFYINFDSNIFDIIHEAELFEQMGFELPDVITEIGIQKNRLRSDIDVTETMINDYNRIMSNLESADVRIIC